MKTIIKQNVSRIYLTLIPFLCTAIGLVVGHVSYKIYLPIWIINVFLMTMATWFMGASILRTHDVEKKSVVACALFLIVPSMLISLITGLGRPPFGKPAEWVATASEQDIRYIILIIAGVLYASGFAILREKLKNTQGNFYSLLGFIAMQIAIPLFIMDMTFLNFYVAKLYGIMAESGLEKAPEWARPTANQFNFIPIIVGSLIYMSSAAYAVALKNSGWFKPTACKIYIVISLLGFILNILPPSIPEPFATASFIATIPAIPFFIPYIMGINLLRKVNIQLLRE